MRHIWRSRARPRHGQGHDGQRQRRRSRHCGIALRHLNSLRSVKLCQSRRATFAFPNRRASQMTTPRMFVTVRRRDGRSAKGTSCGSGATHTTSRSRSGCSASRAPRRAARTGRGTVAELTLFFQEYLADGRHVQGVRRRQHVVVGRRTEAGVASVAMSGGVTDTVIRAGRAFAMSVYGIDFFYRDGQAVVLDVNDFPSFRGFRDPAGESSSSWRRSISQASADAVTRPSECGTRLRLRRTIGRNARPGGLAPRPTFRTPQAEA